MKPILIIVGPTATGKTHRALEIAKRLNGELISADSRQIFRFMNIGTGKDIDSNTENRISNIEYKPGNYVSYYMKEGVPIWLYDLINPDEEFSVAQYERIAKRVISDILSRGKLPIVVGGTGLYIKSLIEPIETVHIPPNKELRESLSHASLRDLQARVQDELPEIWEHLNNSDRQNPRRLLRKIEIAVYYKHQIHPGNENDKEEIKQQEHRSQNISTMIGLTCSFPELYKRIDMRVEKRVEDGVVGEIQELMKHGYVWSLPAMNALGYKEWREYLEDPTDEKKQHAIKRWKFNEHAYARRQMTWFKKQKNITWIDIEDPSFQEKIFDILKKGSIHS